MPRLRVGRRRLVALPYGQNTSRKMAPAINLFSHNLGFGLQNFATTVPTTGPSSPPSRSIVPSWLLRRPKPASAAAVEAVAVVPPLRPRPTRASWRPSATASTAS
uniref:(northern house mosquito) hypothetical protein n=1 Tax=Culex pipiens TaxID=7175 RepID=A0A8D8PGJ3_CULPI